MRRARCHNVGVLIIALLAGGAPSIAAAQTDLVASITSITVTGTQVTFNLQVCNSSAVKAPNSQVALYYHLAAAPDCTTAPSQTWMVMSLNPSECKTINHTQANATAGKLTAWARADYNCQVSESNETNNNSSKAYSVAGDLQVQTVTASVTGSTVTYTITVRNWGVTVTTPFTLALYYDLPAAPTCTSTASQTWTINGLASNGTVTQQHVRANAPAGSYEAWALVDSGCTVEEGNELNNVASRSYGVGPDITLSPATAAVSGTAVSYSVQVCNHGTVATGAFSVKLWYNAAAAPACATGGADHTWSVTSLPAWSGDQSTSCTTLTHARSNAPAGNYQAWFLADAACAVAESDETNNVRSTFYAVSPGSPDLFVSSFSATTSGGTVTFAALVCNAGLPITSGFEVGFYYNRPGAPGCAPVPDAIVTQAGLASGSCVTLTHVRGGAPAGSYTGWALADRGCAIAESNEGNNTASAGYVVAAPPPDLGMPDAPVTDGSPKLDSKPTSPDAKGDGAGGSGQRDGPRTDAAPNAGGDGPASAEAGAAMDLGGDAARPVPPKDEGCGCSVAGPGDGLWLMLALGLLLRARRRRRG